MLELKRTKVEVSLDGKVYNLRLPTYRESIAYSKKIEASKGQGEDQKADLLIGYLADLGLPKDASESLELEHISQVLEFITGAKKK